MYLSLLGLVLLVAVPVAYSRMTRVYTDEIRRNESAVSMLEVKVEDQAAEVARLAAEEDELRRKRAALSDPGQEPAAGAARSAPAEAPAAPEDYLVAAGLLSRKDLELARGHKAGIHSEHSLAEILVMMKAIDASDWEFARAKVEDEE
ncbi:hypothetical protein [Desulfocurvus sp. DL9XJH121]